MTEAIYRQNTGQQDYTASGTVAAGEILQLDDGRAAVAKVDMVSGDKAAVYTEGIFDVTSGSSTVISIGAPVYWDTSASAAVAETSAGEDDFCIGTAVAAKTSGQLVVRVDLNAGVGYKTSNFILSHVVEIDTETDATVHTLIPAAWNKSGMFLLAAFGIVSEAFAGGSQDQGIVTLKDTGSSPNTICTLTPSDGGADAIKDVIQASGGVVMGAATGALMVLIPAAKGVTAACTQAVSGAGAAGKMRVQCIGIPYLR